MSGALKGLDLMVLNVQRKNGSKIFIEQNVITASLFLFNLVSALMPSLFHCRFCNVLHHEIKTFVVDISRQMPHDLI